jgi:tRNA pseudouridine55 synthase
MDGFITIDKPAGLTSQAVVARVKRILGCHKAGHTGTLDPLATGVLPVALGKATRLIPYLDESVKVYSGELCLGVETDTYDRQGTIRRQFTGNMRFSQPELEMALADFTGTISQVPPSFSALKYKGKPLYALARSGNPVIPPPRQITVHSFELLSMKLPKAKFRICCSRGTYIRSLVHDIGLQLGCGAMLTRLVREQSGPFLLEDAVELEQLKTAVSQSDFSNVISMTGVLSRMPALTIEDEELLALIRTGSALPEQRITQSLTQPPGTEYKLIDSVGNLLAIACLVLENSYCQLRMKRVFLQ